MTDLVVRISVLGFYAAAAGSFFLGFPPAVEVTLRYGTAALLLAHAAEVVLCFRWVKAYPGPVSLSIVLTLLFGFVHWMPYRKRALAEAGR